MNWGMAREVGLFTYFAKRIRWRLLQRSGREAVHHRLPGGQEIVLPFAAAFASDIFCTNGHVDWGAEQLLLEYLHTHEKGVCYDVGANMGYYSRLLSGAATEVVAFEPDPRNHFHLQGQRIANLTIVEKAVSDTCGAASFDISDASTVGHLMLEELAPSTFTVETTTLDEYRSTHLSDVPVRAVKIDIEGYEILALRGAAALIQRDQPLFVVEYGMGGVAPNSVEGLDHFLKEHGYTLYAMSRQPALPWSYRTLLQRLTAEDVATLDLKMLFLVPRGDEFFRNKCEQGWCFEKERNQHAA